MNYRSLILDGLEFLSLNQPLVASRPLQQRFANEDGSRRGRMMREAEKVLKANMEKLMGRGFNESMRLSPGGPDPRHH
ncbi:hypothetical protein YC2023_016876 [Brassica napus]